MILSSSLSFKSKSKTTWISDITFYHNKAVEVNMCLWGFGELLMACVVLVIKLTQSVGRTVAISRLIYCVNID